MTADRTCDIIIKKVWGDDFLEKKQLAEKSTKFVILEAIALVAAIAMAALMFFVFFAKGEKFGLILAILSTIVGILAVFLTFDAALKPKVIIEHDIYGVYLNYTTKTVYLRYKDINHALSDRMHGRGMTYDFGSLYIWTDNKRYKIRGVKNVEEVSDFINKKIEWKYSTKKSYRKL